jgi:squalene synthase HpnD
VNDQNQPAAARASGSSFYAAMRILPRAQREAMFEIYSFCRAVDDIADDEKGQPRDERQQQLRVWRQDIDALYGNAPPARLGGLHHAVQRFGLLGADFHAVIDGMEMDVLADIRAPDWGTLDTYCDRVASAVGRLSVRIFGMEERDGIALAHHLGRALQLTNILRDVDEDAGIGRLYLPREALQNADISATEPAAVLANPGLGKACSHVIERARQHFAEADIIMARSPRKAVRAPRIMGEVYAYYLSEVATRGFAPPRPSIKIPRPRLAWILLRHAIV